MAKGFLQKEGIDFDEVFAPVARIETIRLVVGLANMNNWQMCQMDVKCAFLNGPLEEEVYIAQPAGFVKQEEERKVYKLQKSMYGLKQVIRCRARVKTSVFQKRTATILTRISSHKDS